MSISVSIIIPVYNDEDMIEIPLESLIKQTYNNFEVIVVDDGSKDKTSKIIKEYAKKDSRFKYMFQENNGVASARNLGLANAVGDYVCFLDSDDFYEEMYIEKMYTQVVRTKSEVCYCGYKIVSNEHSFDKKTKFLSKNLLNDYILGKVNIHTTGWMIEKYFLEYNKIKFPEITNWGEDFEFFCEVLACAETVSYVTEYLTNYRIGFDENRLSHYSINKLDKDFSSIMRVKNNSIINKYLSTNEALIEYRLSALLTYNLLDGFRHGESKKNLINYYNKYKDYINMFSWNNKLRSFKLNFNKIKLKYKIFLANR